MKSTDTEVIMFLQSAHNRRCAKHFTRQSDGTTVCKSYDEEKRWNAELCRPRDLRSLAVILGRYSARQDCVAVVGALKDETAQVNILRRSVGEQATITHAMRHWLMVDLDAVEVSATDPHEQIHEAWTSILPESLRHVTCWYQFTSSAGTKGANVLSARFAFWLDAAVDTRVLRLWSKAAPCLDAALYVCCQPIYVAAPTFENMSDPLTTRCGILEGLVDEVPTADMQLGHHVRVAEQLAAAAGQVRRADVEPVEAQIAAVIDTIMAQRSTSGGRHDHALGATCELYALGAEPERIAEVVRDIIVRQGREPDNGEIERMLEFAKNKSATSGISVDRQPLAQVLGDIALSDVGADDQTKAGDIDAPMAMSNSLSDAGNAIAYLAQCHPEGTFIRWGEQDWEYNGKFWERLENKEILKARIDQAGGAHLSQSKANNTAAKVRGLTMREKLSLPGWLSKEGQQASHAVVMRNGMVFLEDVLMSRETALLPHCKDYFCTYMLPFDYDPHAACPRWRRCVDEWFLDDEASKRELQKMFGYLLVPDNKYEKFFVLTDANGRAGKGTAVRVLEWLLGDDAVGASTFTGLAKGFGLGSLLTRSLLLFNEANAQSVADVPAAAVDRLKMITGNDKLEVELKGKDSIYTQLKLRVVMSCNRLPNVRDPSGALMKRMHMLEFKQTFSGREDNTLKNIGGPLHRELPGIFLWALEGLKMLEFEDKGFRQPDSVHTQFARMARIAAPIRGFIEDCVSRMSAGSITSQDYIEKQELHSTYRIWCEHEGVRPLSRHRFYQELETVMPGLVEGRPGGKSRAYYGLRYTDTGNEIQGLEVLKEI